MSQFGLFRFGGFFVYTIFAAFLLLAIIGSLLIGPLSISFFEIATSWSTSIQDQTLQLQKYVIVELRIPRVLTAFAVGGGLAICGVCMQGLFRNPLADPGLIGVSSGSALGAVLIIVLGNQILALSGIGVWFLPVMLPLAAFFGGVIVTYCVYKVASFGNKTDTALLLLAGVAINAICGAATGLLTYIANDNQLRDLTFWSMGSVGKNDWYQLSVSVPIILISSAFLIRYRKALNSFLMGEAVAEHVGFNVVKIKKYIIFICSIVVGASVAISGVILFVGLVVPHILRQIIGPDHKHLMPIAFLSGATLVLVADVFSRMIISPSELPIGLFMSILGGPFFLFLLIKQKKSF